MRNLAPVVVLLIVGGVADPLYAACTAIPEQPLFIRGARGSIDRPFVSPDVDEVVTLHAAARKEGELAHPLTAADLLITAVFKSPAAKTAATFFVAGDDGCEHLEEPACFVERLLCHAPRHCAAGTAMGLSVSSDGGVAEVRFRFPQTRGAGPMALAVTAAGQPPPLELQTETCHALIKSHRRSDLLVCIDAFRLADVDPPGVQPLTTHLIGLPASNDYQAVCKRDVGDIPKCTGKLGEIQYTVDLDGNVLVPMNWSKILRPNSGGGLARRELRASTAVEAIQGQPKPVYIPSAAFLETVSQQGGSFSPSPVFAPQELPDRPREQTVIGTADKGKSVLKFDRRKLWDHACSGGANQSQACEPETEAADCPSALCAATTLAYFACAGGGRNAQPCTRPEHCPGGTCQNISTGGSTCYVHGVANGVSCKTDGDCGANGECGAGLFEYRDRVVNGVGILHRVATSSAPGICDSGSKEGQVCTSGLTCNPLFFGPTSCVTYRAEALTYP